MSDAAGRRRSPWRGVLGNRHVVAAILGYAASSIAEWALWVAVLVHAFELGGATASGIASITLLVPAMLVAPFAGRTADGPRPNRVFAAVLAAQALALALLAVTAATEAPLPVFLLPGVAVTGLLTFVRPCIFVVVPGLVHDASELTAANVAIGWCDGAAVLLGPLLAGALLAAGGPAALFIACGAIVAAATVGVLPLRRLDPDVPAPDEAEARAVVRPFVEALRDVAARPGGGALLRVAGGQYVLVGALDLLIVLLAADVLGLGPSAPGVLGAVLGGGAVLAGAVTARWAGRRRLAPIIVASLVATVVGLGALGAWTTVGALVVVLPLLGLARSLIDVTSRMLLQRVSPQHAVASVFAGLELIGLACCAIGSLVVQVGTAVAGPRAATLAVGVVIALLLVTSVRALRRAEDVADAPVTEVRLLRRIPTFGALRGPQLELVARSTRPLHAPSGDVIVRQGEPGDRYYAIVDGHVEVRCDGRFVRTMGRGEGFGEVALLADVARTATVVATDDTDLLVIERTDFLIAVTGHDASQRTAWATARRYVPELGSAA